MEQLAKGRQKLVKSHGADATFNYRNSPEIQLKEIEAVTKGKFSKLFDPSAASSETAFEALLKVSTATGSALAFATTDDW